MAELDGSSVVGEQSEAHRQAVGGLWEKLGELQLDFLVDQGLKPFHYLLDIGCGSLRGGVRFISYLEPGHYFGVDKDRALLDAGRDIELARHRLLDRAAVLLELEDFDFSVCRRTFDFALAQSVFTHLDLNKIIRCVMNVEKALVGGGRFYATFFENAAGKFDLHPLAHSRQDGPDLLSHFDADPFHYDFETFRWICRGTRVDVTYLGDWGHPRGQKMLVFTKR